MLKHPQVVKNMNPYKSLLKVSIDTHEQISSVIESFTDNNLSFKIDSYDRTIAQVLSHTLTTFKKYFIEHLVNGKSVDNYSEPEVNTTKEALELIQTSLNTTSQLIQEIPEAELSKEIKTEWGQVMIKELVVWQGITQMNMHLGEICVMAGIGGFYKGVLG